MSARLPRDPALTPAEFAREVHALLASVDRARWRTGSTRVLREALEDLRQRASSLAARAREAVPGDAEHRVHAAALRLYEALPDPRHLDSSAEWRRLRTRLSPLYARMATALRHAGEQVDLLRPANLKRNVFHAGMGLVALLVYLHLLTWGGAVAVAAGFCAVAWSLELVRQRLPWLNDRLMAVFGPLARDHERYRVNGATWFGTAMLLLLLTTPGLAGILGLVAVSFGDPAASIVGTRWGRTKLRSGRSLEGFLAFAGTATATGALALALAFPELTAGGTLLLAATAGLAGAAAELVAVRIDDNFAVPVAAALAAALMRLAAGL